MAFKSSYLNFVETNISKVHSTFSGLKMLELGDQIIKAKEPYPEDTGKEYFQNRGFEHISVDLNGMNGSLVRDLTNESQFLEWNNYFDVVTNSGTSEHVEPYEKQFECFKIIHDCQKVNGVAVHLIPDIVERDKTGAWFRHCHYYYSKEFFEMLAAECNYEILENTVIEGLRSVALKKLNNNSFMADRSKFLSLIAQRNWTKEHFRPE